MKPYILIALLGAFALSSCKSPEDAVLNTAKVNGEKIPVIHFENVKGDPLETGISEIIDDFEIICLETRDECLIQGIQQMAFYDDKLLVATQYFPDPAPVFMFDRSGKFIKRVGKGGRGPGEYTGYMVYSILKDKYIKINFLDKIQLFDREGELIGELKEPMELCGDSYRVADDLYICPGTITGYPAYLRDSVMLVFHNQEGEILKSIARQEYPPTSKAGYTPVGWNKTSYRYDNKWNLYMASIDTLYSVYDMGIKPRLIFDFGDTEQPYNQIADAKTLIGKKLYSIVAENEFYWIFRNAELRSLEVNEYRPGRWSSMLDMDRELVFIDKKDGAYRKVNLIDDIWELGEDRRINDFSYILDNNKLVYSMQASEIKIKIEEKLNDPDLDSDVRQRLEDLDSKITEESNPVIFVYHLKDRIQMTKD